MTYFCPSLDPPLGGSGRKTTTLVRDHEYFMHTKFHQNPSSGSGEEVENVKVYGRRRTDGRTTDDGRCAMTIAHLSLWLRWAKNICFDYWRLWLTELYIPDNVIGTNKETCPRFLTVDMVLIVLWLLHRSTTLWPLLAARWVDHR